VSSPLVRRLRLPAVGTSPATARNAVGALLGAAGLAELRDEALLLTSELVTNAVIHAGTELELEIMADPGGVRVTVTDFGAPSSAVVATEVRAARAVDAVDAIAVRGFPRRTSARGHRISDQGDGDNSGGEHGGGEQGSGEQGGGDDSGGGADATEGGRGLLLVSRFASRWGTSHEPGGRAIWFRLDRHDRQRDDPSADRPADPDESTVDTSLAAALTGVLGPGVPNTLPALLARLTAGLAATTTAVSVDRGDGRGLRVLARHSRADAGAPAADGRTIRVGLPLARPWTAELTATAASSRHAQTIAELAAMPLALLVENQRLTEAHDDGRGWLLFLAEAGELLARSMNVDLTVALIPRLVVPRLGRWCAVHLADEYGELVPAALAHADESATADLAGQLDRTIAGRPGILDSAAAVPLGPPTHGLSVPLRVRGERLGLLTVGRRGEAAHGADELAIIEDLARRASGAIDNARVHDQRTHITTTLQRSLLPPTLPAIDGLEVAAQYVPAGDDLDVGGDFYDLIPVPGDGWMLVVGDVSGKGVGAAAVTGLVRDVLHTLALDHRAPEQTLARLNATLVERGGGYYCTLALAFVSPAPDGFDLSLHLAGHDQPVLLRADGSTSMVGIGGTALGLLDEVISPRTTVHLGPGDALVLYTDGVTERRRGRLLFGQRRLRNLLAAQVGAPAATLAAGLRSAVLEFGHHPPRDDIAIVVLRPPGAT
jgi:serine phosphatase RsbU (regulator of sigma subunit)